MFHCSICHSDFKDFSRGGYVQDKVVHCPDCDERKGIPITIITDEGRKVVYTRNVHEALEVIGREAEGC